MPRDSDSPRLKPLREQPLSRLFPNMVTIGGLCCGLSAIRFSLTGRWDVAVAFVLAAAIIDGMDGRLARLLGATSVFGAQLDSLSDFVCFGVAPPVVMYLWQLHEVKGLGWAVVLFFGVCCALRLARFNTVLATGAQAPWQKAFFTGVPAPAGGLLCLWPLILSLQFGQELLPAWASVVFDFLVAVLMASRVPTLAAKNVHIRQELILPFTVAAALVVVLFIIEPWWALSAGSVAYLVSIAYAQRHYRRLRDQYASDTGFSLTE